MVRSMYSGVSGLRSHQTRMDTIGNNIANVNTYGFKSGRTTFRDIYYQTMTSASGPTAAQGGINPSAVGYGAKIGSVDLMMDQSTFTMTSQTMDIAIDGDGFFQVQDGEGNIYYTRAGMLNFDSAGNLVDMQGNYVLGVNGDPTGRAPASERIAIALAPVPPTPSSVVQNVNGLEFTISATNPTSDGNLNFNFTTDPSLADDQVVASISTTGVIVNFHPDNVYGSLAEFNAAINAAITEANGGEPHVAGNFTVTYTGPAGDNPFLPANMPAGGYRARDICSVDYKTQLGRASFTTPNVILGGVAPNGTVGSGFGAHWTGGVTEADMGGLRIQVNADGNFEFSMDIGGTTYTGVVDSSKGTSGKFMMANAADPTDYFEMTRPSFGDIQDAWEDTFGAAPAAGDDETIAAADLGVGGVVPVAEASTPSIALGFSSMAFALRGGTQGGPQTIADMTGIQIAPNGIITGWDSQGLEIVVGRIDLATFANPGGLTLSGSSNYTASANSGAPILTQPGTGGAGGLVTSTLELSNVDLSREFSDMITTQRGYQANSRIITVSDTMLEELINLKR